VQSLILSPEAHSQAARKALAQIIDFYVDVVAQCPQLPKPQRGPWIVDQLAIPLQASRFEHEFEVLEQASRFVFKVSSDSCLKEGSGEGKGE